MRLKLRLVTLAEDGQEIDVVDVATLDKGYERVEQVGLTLAESKEILRETQRHLVGRQVAAFVEARARCECGKRLGSKGHHTIVFRTLFGNISIESPRLRHCLHGDALGVPRLLRDDGQGPPGFPARR